MCSYGSLSGSVLSKARARGVSVQSLKLPPITDFAAGKTRVVCHVHIRATMYVYLHVHSVLCACVYMYTCISSLHALI